MVINLREINSFVSVERLITVIGDEFLKTPSFTKACKNDIIVEPKGFRIVTPHENDFPGTFILHYIKLLYEFIYFYSNHLNFNAVLNDVNFGDIFSLVFLKG